MYWLCFSNGSRVWLIWRHEAGCVALPNCDWLSLEVCRCPWVVFCLLHVGFRWEWNKIPHLFGYLHVFGILDFFLNVGIKQYFCFPLFIRNYLQDDYHFGNEHILCSNSDKYHLERPFYFQSLISGPWKLW